MFNENNFGAMGKGLSAQSFIKSGTILFEEKPLVHMQYSWNKKYNYLACDECMKPLENVEENLRRLTGDKSLIVPYKELCKILPLQKDIVKCENCDLLYCSIQCKDEAKIKYHKVLCPNGGCISKQFLEEFEQIWNEIHYPPESSNLMILIKIVAMIIQSEQKLDLINVFNGFCQSTTGESNELLHKILDKKYSNQLKVLFEMFREHLYTECISNWFTYEGFLNLIALICRNSQGIATNSFSLWMKGAESQYENDPKFDDYVQEIYEKIENHVGQFIDNEGIGLYRNQSLINHSCDPNCEIKFSGENNILSVVSIKDINIGEQIYISYLDECQLERSRHSRQKHLREYYLFNCTCEKCNDQNNDKDETSDDDDDEDEEDDEMME